MHISLMRILDYWAGIGLCLLASFLQAAGSFWRRRPSPSMVKKIACIKLSEMGAIILSYPLLQQLRRRYPGSDIFFVTFRRNAEVFSVLADAVLPDNILTIRDDSLGHFVRDTLKVLCRLRRERIDLLFDLEFFCRATALFSYLSKARKRIGFYRYSFEGLYRGNLMTHRVLYNPLLHISRTYLSLLQAAAEEFKTSPPCRQQIDESQLTLPRYRSDARLRQALQERLESLGVDRRRSIFLVNPGEGELPLRQWPLDRFIEVCRRLCADDNSRIVIVGAANAAPKARLMQQSLGSRFCINLAKATSCAELLELCTMARALLCNDCGLAHLAMLAPVETFVIFGPESPQVFAPRGAQAHILYASWPCSPCLSALNHRASSCRDARCLDAISADQVYELMRQNRVTV